VILANKPPLHVGATMQTNTCTVAGTTLSGRRAVEGPTPRRYFGHVVVRVGRTLTCWRCVPLQRVARPLVLRTMRLRACPCTRPLRSFWRVSSQ
jgi:hypothetical protein